jgi:hypothetical protein
MTTQTPLSPLQVANQARSQQTREKIAAAYERICETFDDLTSIADRRKALLAHAQVSYPTLNKHLDLWHPEHNGETEVINGLQELAANLDDISHVVRVGNPTSVSPSADEGHSDSPENLAWCVAQIQALIQLVSSLVNNNAEAQVLALTDEIASLKSQAITDRSTLASIQQILANNPPFPSPPFSDETLQKVNVNTQLVEENDRLRQELAAVQSRLDSFLSLANNLAPSPSPNISPPTEIAPPPVPTAASPRQSLTEEKINSAIDTIINWNLTHDRDRLYISNPLILQLCRPLGAANTNAIHRVLTLRKSELFDHHQLLGIGSRDNRFVDLNTIVPQLSDLLQSSQR